MKCAKTCFLTADMSPRSGGVYEAILGQATAVQSVGRAAEIVTVMPPGQFPATMPDGLAIRPVPATRQLTTACAPELATALDACDATLLHAHGLWIPSISMGAHAWQRRRGDPLVISPHGMLDPWALKNSRWKKRLAMALYEGRNLKTAHCLHALNLAEAKAIRALGFKTPIAVIPNGVDLPNSIATPANDSSKDGRKVLLFLGRLHPKKGLVETLLAWAKALALRPELRKDWRVVIAGWDDGNHLATLKELVKDLGLDQDVDFPGPVYGDYKKNLLSNADAFILASHSEGLPMSVLEAWAYRRPVFMTQNCNLPDGFTEGAAIEIGTSSDAIAKVLVNHLDLNELQTIGARGRQLVETHYSWKNIGRQLDDLYAWLLGESDTRPETVLN